jgi:hypothetical protein
MSAMTGATFNPHPEEPRALARRFEGWKQALVADPSRRGQEAAPQDEDSAGGQDCWQMWNLIGHDTALRPGKLTIVAKALWMILFCSNR